MEVARPKIVINGYYKEFGFGFYCTNFEKQAKRWTLTKQGNSVVNRYHYHPNHGLKILSFGQMSEECDIVEGSMADDQIWNYVEGFISAKIPRDSFWGLVRFSYPTHQIVFCTEIALAALSFKGSDQV